MTLWINISQKSIAKSLKESELMEDIDELNKQISQLEAMNESLKHKPL